MKKWNIRRIQMVIFGLVLGICAGAILGLFFFDPANMAIFGGGVGLVTGYILWFLWMKSVEAMS